MQYIEFETRLTEYIEMLTKTEQSKNTIIKYKGDITKFIVYAKLNCGSEVIKDDFIAYKNYLIQEDYKKTSINSYIIALNKYLRYISLDDLCVKPLKIQQNVSVENIIEMPEYRQVIDYLIEKRNKTTYLIVRTIASTGIRVSELEYLTVDAMKDGCMEVTNKDKTRQVVLTDDLLQELNDYCENKGIKTGIIFRGKNPNKGLHPTSIWRRIKTAANHAEIDQSKAFPHNLRHLFAKTYMDIFGNISDLADLLGHENINTTRIYNRKTKGERRVNLNRLGL